MDFSSERIDKPQKSKIPEEVIEKALLSAQTGNSGTFENIPEESGTVENVPAGRIGKERRVKERMGVLRARARSPHPPRVRILKSSRFGLMQTLLMWVN